jgi:hypothetical protein
MTKKEILKQAIYANKKDRRIKLIRQAWEDFDKSFWFKLWEKVKGSKIG